MRADAFVRVCAAEYLEWAEGRAFRAYVTDALRLVPQGKYTEGRWVDMVRPRTRPHVDPEGVLGDLERRGVVTIK